MNRPQNGSPSPRGAKKAKLCNLPDDEVDTANAADVHIKHKNSREDKQNMYEILICQILHIKGINSKGTLFRFFNTI
jgi:hypothetical protein